MKANIWMVWLALLMIGSALALPAPVAVAQQDDAGPKASIWDGVYTKTQDARGQEVHSGVCASCHGSRLNGAGQPDMPPSPAIARATFLHKWAGKTVATLFEYVRTKMPPENPGMLSNQEYIDAIAHMFAVSNMPAGDKELLPDPKTLAGIVIKAQPK